MRSDLVDKACKLIESFGFKCYPALCALEAKPPVEWDKGRAAIYILRTAFGVDWNERIRIVFAGDDVGDEDAILALKGTVHMTFVVSACLNGFNKNLISCCGKGFRYSRTTFSFFLASFVCRILFLFQWKSFKKKLFFK